MKALSEMEGLFCSTSFLVILKKNTAMHSSLRVLFATVLVLFACHTGLRAQARLKLADSKQNFGFVKKGEVVKLSYAFTNTGDQPLVITEAKVECSCTSIDFPRQPIAPGQSGVIAVSFDTKSVYDRQDRTVELFSNAPGSPHKIRFKGVVLKP